MVSYWNIPNMTAISSAARRKRDKIVGYIHRLMSVSNLRSLSSGHLLEEGCHTPMPRSAHLRKRASQTMATASHSGSIQSSRVSLYGLNVGFTTSRAAVKRVVKTQHKMMVASMMGYKDLGSTKLGTIPGGGPPADCEPLVIVDSVLLVQYRGK